MTSWQAPNGEDLAENPQGHRQRTAVPLLTVRLLLFLHPALMLGNLAALPLARPLLTTSRIRPNTENQIIPSNILAGLSPRNFPSCPTVTFPYSALQWTADPARADKRGQYQYFPAALPRRWPTFRPALTFVLEPISEPCSPTAMGLFLVSFGGLTKDLSRTTIRGATADEMAACSEALEPLHHMCAATPFAGPS